MIMNNQSDRPRVLRAIRKCLSDAYDHLQNAMDELDEIGDGSLGTGMTPLIGGYLMPNPKDKYTHALIDIDSAEKSLKPLIRRFSDGRVDRSHFRSDEAMIMLRDIAEFEFGILISRLSERSGRESVWYRLRELTEKLESVFHLVAEK
jgi:hypothetical protein